MPLARGAANAPGARRPRRGGRFSAPRKTEAITRLIRGESIDLLSRELGVTAATLADWRDTFLAAGQTALKSREATAQDDEIARLKELVGDLTMRLELSREAVSRLKGGLPLAPWRSSR